MTAMGHGARGEHIHVGGAATAAWTWRSPRTPSAATGSLPAQARHHRSERRLGRDARVSHGPAAHQASAGAFVTTAVFTPRARAEAQRADRKVALVDGARLARLPLRHEMGARPERTRTLYRLDEDPFEELEGG